MRSASQPAQHLSARYSSNEPGKPGGMAGASGFYNAASMMTVFLVAPELEQAFRAAAGSPEAAAAGGFVVGVSGQIGSGIFGTGKIRRHLILTTQEVRKNMWRRIHMEFPNVSVVSYQEVDPSVNITPISRIS